MGATPDRPRPKPTLICHIRISIKLKQSRLQHIILNFAINAQASGMLGWQLEMILVYS